MLTTKEQVKTRLGLTGSTNDAEIDAIIAAVSLGIAAHCNRVDSETWTSRMEYFADAVITLRPYSGDRFVRLSGFPIASVSEVVEAQTEARLVDATPLAEGEDFYREGRFLIRLTNGADRNQAFARAGGVVRVTYSGGYWTGAVEDLPSGAIELPADIAEAALIQSAHQFRNRTKLGERSIQVGDMSVSEVKDGMLTTVKELLAPHVDVAFVG